MTSRRSAYLAMACTAALLAIALAILFSARRGPHPEGPSPAAARPADLPPLQPVDFAVYRKAYDLDPGTLRVCLRNLGSRPLTFMQVRLDGIDIPVWGVDWQRDSAQAKRPQSSTAGGKSSAGRHLACTLVVWARLDPPEIQPGRLAEFVAKLASPLPRPMKLEFVPQTGNALTCVVRPVDHPLAISAVSFAEGSPTPRAYVYIEARSPDPLAIRGIECDGQWLADGLWLAATTLAKGDKTLAIVELDPPRTQGSFLTVKVLCTDGFAAEERVRVLPGFPINAEGGPVPQGFGLDPTPYVHRPSYLDPAKPGRPPRSARDPSLRGNYIFQCAMHSYGLDKHRTAREILRRYDLCRRHDPHHPGVQHLCRIRPETGYALFGELADIVRINANIRTSLDTKLRRAAPIDIVAGISRAARLAVRPRLVHAVADTSPFGETKGFTDPAAFRRRVYAILSESPRGLFYRHRGWAGSEPGAKALNAEIRRLNAELAHLRSYLAIADVWPWPRAPQRPDLLASALLAGDQALLLILVRRTPPEGQPLPKGQTLQLAIDLPPSLAPRRAACITPDGPQPLATIRAGDDGALTLDVALPDTASAYLIDLGRGAR